MFPLPPSIIPYGGFSPVRLEANPCLTARLPGQGPPSRFAGRYALSPGSDHVQGSVSLAAIPLQSRSVLCAGSPTGPSLPPEVIVSASVPALLRPDAPVSEAPGRFIYYSSPVFALAGHLSHLPFFALTDFLRLPPPLLRRAGLPCFSDCMSRSHKPSGRAFPLGTRSFPTRIGFVWSAVYLTWQQCSLYVAAPGLARTSGPTASSRPVTRNGIRPGPFTAKLAAGGSPRSAVRHDYSA